MVVIGMVSEFVSAAVAEQSVATAEVAVGMGFDSDFVVVDAEFVGLAAASGCGRSAAAPVVVVGLA